MKTLSVLILSVLVVACFNDKKDRLSYDEYLKTKEIQCDKPENEPCLCYNQIVMKDKAKVIEAVIKIMATVKVKQRGENEDWDDFVEEVNSTVHSVYARNIRGKIIPLYGCDCSEELANAEATPDSVPTVAMTSTTH